MEEKIALVNCLALLHLETTLGDKGAHKELIKRTTSQIRTPDFVSDGDAKAALSGVKILIDSIADGDLEFDKHIVLQKIRVYCSFDRNLYDTIKEVFEIEYGDEDAIRKAISANTSHLTHFNRITDLRKLISTASYSINNGRGGTFNEIAKKLSEDLSDVVDSTASESTRSTLVDSVGTVDREGMSRIFESTKKQLNGNTLKSGWLGLNRMLGVNGGFVPGELVLMPALPHNGKTLFSLLTFISLAVHNTATDFLPDDKKDLKPLLLDLSFENELEVNLPIAYRALRENAEGKAINIHDIDPDEATAYICDTLLEKYGWHYQFERHINSDFSIDDFEETMLHYERLGYYIVGVRADYLGTINRANLGSGAIGSDVRELYRRARNVTSPRKCLLLAPHQLSPKAKELKAMDPLKYVQNLPGKGMYDGCTTVDNEADLELYFGITEVGGKSYLEVARGKHRTLIDTPLAHRYRVFPFNDIGTLPWDVLKGDDTSLKSVSAGAMQNEGSDMFDYEEDDF